MGAVSFADPPTRRRGRTDTQEPDKASENTTEVVDKVPSGTEAASPETEDRSSRRSRRSQPEPETETRGEPDKNPEPGTETRNDNEQTEVTVRPDATVGFVSTGQIQGEVDHDDINTPRLNLCQKSGKLSDDFPVGDFIFDKAVNLGDEIRVIVCAVRKYYREVTDFDGDEIGKIYNTTAEYREDGKFIGRENGDVMKSADIIFLIESPDEEADKALRDHGDADFEDEDKTPYLLALMTVQSSSYQVFKTIYTASKRHLKNKETGEVELERGVWTMSRDKRSNPKNTWFVPILKTAGASRPEVQEFIVENFKKSEEAED